MPLFDWLFGRRKPTITHKNSDDFTLETIADGTYFTRIGDGLTIITGPVGHGVKLRIEENGHLIIRGNIGTGCHILKDGLGALIIEGTVTDDLKLTVYGRGPVSFTRQPPESVIAAIKNLGGVAQISCAGSLLPAPAPEGYVRHNLGRPRPEQRAPLPQLLAERPAPAPRVQAAVDQYSDLTKEYIETFKAHKTKAIATRINELELTEEEEPLFERFVDHIITKDYIDDVPVMYNEHYYSLSVLLQWSEMKKEDPQTRQPFKLANIQPACKISTDLDDVIKALKVRREAAKAKLVEEQPGLISP